MNRGVIRRRLLSPNQLEYFGREVFGAGRAVDGGRRADRRDVGEGIGSDEAAVEGHRELQASAQGL